MELDLARRSHRSALREWIAAQTPPGLVELTDWNTVITASGNRGARLARASAHPPYAEWTAKLAARRFPALAGSTAARAWTRCTWRCSTRSSTRRRGAPRVTRGMGDVGRPSSCTARPGAEGVLPAAHHQRRGHVLPGFLRAEPRLDLAAVETRGVVEGDEIVITGQKVWTSGAARATRTCQPVRTDPEAEKHRGLSYVLFDFKAASATVGSLRWSRFAELLDGVRAPLFNLIGGLNNGWQVAMTTLGHERVRRCWPSSASSGIWSRRRASTASPATLVAAARLGLHAGRDDGLRTLAQVAKAGRQARRPRWPSCSGASLSKRLGEIAMGIEGGDGLRPDGDGYAVSKWQNVFLSGRASTIYWHQRDPAQHHRRTGARPAERNRGWRADA